jgi:serine/threonine-protein kinase
MRHHVLRIHQRDLRRAIVTSVKGPGMARGVSRPLVITVEEPENGAKWTYVLKNSPVVLGRDQETCDIAFARPSVSKVQAEIAFDDGKMTYRDLDSRNGSIVDGEPIPADVAVKISETSDIVVGGRLRLTFSRDESARGSEGINPFEPPRIRSSLVFEQTAVHIGSIPARPQVQPPAVVSPPASAAPVPIYPMPDPGEQQMTERMPPLAEPPPPPPPAPSEWMEPRPTPVPLKPGDIVAAHYCVVRLIGQGGMGTVYEVSHTRAPSRRFAMKVISTEIVGHPEAESRFMREAEAASRINHPHVVSMIDVGRDRGITYLVMELLEGKDLSVLIANKRTLSIERVVDIMLAVCAGVRRAHELGIIHRDLKPGNIFLSRNHLGDTIPKVLDFGISKVRMPGDTKLTQRFSLIGTPNYVSPEQADGRPVDARCDIYALGTIIYECVTGRQCHEGSTLYEILRSIAQADYPRPTALRPDLQPDLEAVILKCLERNPEARFETVWELGRALVPFGSEKRRSYWRDIYFGPKGDIGDSSILSAAPISLSKFDESARPKTELLPAEEAQQIHHGLFQKGEQRSPAPASTPKTPRPVRSGGTREPRRQEPSPSKMPSETRGMGRLSLPIIIGIVLGGVVLGGLTLYHRRPSADTIAPTQPATESQLPPNAADPTPVQVQLASPPIPPPIANAAPSTAVAPPSAPADKAAPIVPKRRTNLEPSRRSHSHTAKTDDDYEIRHVKRNRSGIPLLDP